MIHIYFNKRYFFLILVFLSMLFIGCTDDLLENDPGNKTISTLEIKISVPGKTTLSGLRSMSIEKETEIDFVQALLFEEIESGKEVFRERYTIKKESFTSPNTFQLKVPISSNNEKYRLVLLTNIPETGKPVDKELKQAALDKITFKCAAEWNAGDANPALIPMWGESSETFTIKKDNNYVKILLHRALARVDIGCGFKFLTPNPSNPSEPIDETDKEAVWGLDIFKIKSARVYRTKNLAYVASASQYLSNNEIIQPYIPSEAIYNSSKTSLGHQNIDDADNDPLTFILPEAADSYIRHIYIPESVIYPTATPHMDETPCLVVGGYYNGNTQKEQFYRADFADYNNGKVSQYKPILRNHRYVFNIKSVTSPGFEHPKHALFSVKANMLLDVIDWTEVNLEQHLNGNYSFKIFNKTDIVLAASEAAATAELPYSFTLLYGTKNIVLDATHNPFNIYWESSQTGNSSYFNLGVDYSQRIIYISPKRNNTTGVNIIDYLSLKAERFVVRIKVIQMRS